MVTAAWCSDRTRWPSVNFVFCLSFSVDLNIHIPAKQVVNPRYNGSKAVHKRTSHLMLFVAKKQYYPLGDREHFSVLLLNQHRWVKTVPQLSILLVSFLRLLREAGCSFCLAFTSEPLLKMLWNNKAKFLPWHLFWTLRQCSTQKCTGQHSWNKFWQWVWFYDQEEEILKC